MNVPSITVQGTDVWFSGQKRIPISHRTGTCCTCYDIKISAWTVFLMIPWTWHLFQQYWRC